MKKVVIIGAGIAGLTCGIYLKLNGFDTEIYEKNSIPGGECTGWDRGDYHFDGCIHWLMGTKSGTNLNRLWHDTGALDDSVKIINHEILIRYEDDDEAVDLYTNADKLERHLLEISPQDKKAIKKLCDSIRKIGCIDIPTGRPMDKMRLVDGFIFMIKYMGKIMKIKALEKIRIEDFAKEFKEPLLQRFLTLVSPGGTAAGIPFMISGMHDGDSGYPLGGSRALARRMEKRYLDLGGKAIYKAEVDKILIEGGKAIGEKLKDGREVQGNYVISCADGHATLYDMLEDRFTPETFKRLYGDTLKYPTPTCALVFIGINYDLSDEPRSLAIRRDKSVTLCGEKSNIVSFTNCSFDKTMAPKGKTVMISFYDTHFDWWNEAYKDKKRYEAAKKELLDDTITALVRRFPHAQGKIEVSDVVTPMTYVRYCNAWRGSWMSWKQGKGVPLYHPGVLPGLSNFIMAGMWTMPPGGLTGAAVAGRFAAHRLCMMNGKTLFLQR